MLCKDTICVHFEYNLITNYQKHLVCIQFQTSLCYYDVKDDLNPEQEEICMITKQLEGRAVESCNPCLH